MEVVGGPLSLHVLAAAVVSEAAPRDDDAVRFLFSSTPLDGHFRPMVPLVRALTARGHRVAVATEVGWHPHVVAEGLEPLAAGPSKEAAWQHAVDALGSSLPWALEHGADQIFAHLFGGGHALPKVRPLAAVAEEWGADVVVSESADLAGPAVAAALGLPFVHHSWGPMIPVSWYEQTSPLVAPGWDALALAQPPLAGMFEGLYVDLAPPTFPGERPAGPQVSLRPAAPDPSAVPAWVKDLEQPLVYVTLGTLFNDPDLLRTLVAALDGVGSAVVTTGRDIDPAELGAVPSHVRVERFIPQAQVLPCAAAAIGHGGAGSTLGALAHGVPLVLLPMGADQFHVSACAAVSGAAVVLGLPEVSAPTVRAALEAVLHDDAHHRAAGAVRDEIATMPDAAEAAVAVEAFAAAGRTSVRPPADPSGPTATVGG